MGGFLQRGILLYLMLAIAIVFAAPEVVFTNPNGSPAEATLLSWFDLDTTDYYDLHFRNESNPQLSSSTIGNETNAFITPTSPSGSGGILGWLDPLYQVFSWVTLIFKMLFSPIILLTDPRVAMPFSVVLLIGIPLVILFIVGLISWIRSGIA